ncbi:MAG: 16S rRNA (adenine(1518)-N(6)/adenine(1519)-N(6))-dimethyltransferase RsmA [Magnetococcales bacterium]|nr:16S rRNA (adenine(1518)-N(6)/adenine(1519)-N(6))-dimethyltransferase RsmA [Magnetococcales bacterium]NGZ27830.1 16S rRNA (adenine(1518)-N(6)/adenine(1519)-N(6))-dimethyltransferase RsmA [Magnetococcales bacterium]
MGQNFLQDPLVISRIIHAAGVKAGDRLVEIGPGLGAMSQPLLKQSGQLWAIELDNHLAKILQQKSSQWPGTFHLLQEDALQVHFQNLAQELGGPLKVVANLPYAISSPLLFHFLDHKSAFSDLTLMLQKEVVDRMAAPPGGKDYGVVSIHLQRMFTITPLFQVPPEAFHPQPKVTSAVVQLVPRSLPLVDVQDDALFHRIVKAAFGQRRKTLSNALSALMPAPWFQESGIDPRRRGETLSIQEFANLTHFLLQKMR